MACIPCPGPLQRPHWRCICRSSHERVLLEPTNDTGQQCPACAFCPFRSLAGQVKQSFSFARAYIFTFSHALPFSPVYLKSLVYHTSRYTLKLRAGAVDKREKKEKRINPSQKDKDKEKRKSPKRHQCLMRWPGRILRRRTPTCGLQHKRALESALV